MTVRTAVRNYLSVTDLTAQETWDLLKLAADLKRHVKERRPHPRLAGLTLAMVFQKPSLRTRVSFEIGMTQLGGHAIYLGPSDIKLGERESIEDVARTLGRMSDLIMARVFGHEIVAGLGAHAGVPVINGLSDLEHPCQALADLLTVWEHRRRLEGQHLVFVGDGNNVAHSLLLGGALMGMHVTVLGPPGFEPRADVLERARDLAKKTGARLAVSHDPADVTGADVVYTDVWASMGQESEAVARREVFRPYQVNDALMARCPNATLLHCLPAHYGEEIEYTTSRRPGSAIFDQAENRLHAQKALMVMLAG